MRTADPAGALAAFAEVVSGARLLLETDPESTDYRRSLQIGLVQLADAQLATGAPEQAVGSCREALGLALQVCAAEADSLGCRQGHAIALSRLGVAARASGDLETARQSWTDALALLDAMLQEDPSLTQEIQARDWLRVELAGLP